MSERSTARGSSLSPHVLTMLREAAYRLGRRPWAHRLVSLLGMLVFSVQLLALSVRLQQWHARFCLTQQCVGPVCMSASVYEAVAL